MSVELQFNILIVFAALSYTSYTLPLIIFPKLAFAKGLDYENIGGN